MAVAILPTWEKSSYRASNSTKRLSSADSTPTPCGSEIRTRGVRPLGDLEDTFEGVLEDALGGGFDGVFLSPDRQHSGEGPCTFIVHARTFGI
ncbi:hypothetical protein QE152_g24359 [Popillia japonica]|uniref:Uncharacterized protein n=1 Tax=Popillia japonica TaxID=7064 RepID=A0AAW1KBI6_POPJA